MDVFWLRERKKSFVEILFKIWPMARNQSSEFKRILDGCFLGLRERKMFWSSEDRVRARFHYAESRQNKP